MPGETHRDDSGRDPCAVQPGGAKPNDTRTEMTGFWYEYGRRKHIIEVPRNGRKSLLIPRHCRDGRISERLLQCNLEGDKIPSARAIQTLVQVWKEMRGWYKRT